MVRVPAGVSTGAITVSNVNGTATTAQVFSLIAVPGVSAASPSHVNRGQTTHIELTGTNLDSATSVTFAQPGFNAQILKREPGRLTIDLTVAGSVPFSAYPFSVTNFAGVGQSGAVVITVTSALTGPSASVSRTVSILAPAVGSGPVGNATSVAPRAVSVHVPLISGGPQGNSTSVTAPISVSKP